jgi:hypothetical protein
MTHKVLYTDTVLPHVIFEFYIHSTQCAHKGADIVVKHHLFVYHGAWHAYSDPCGYSRTQLLLNFASLAVKVIQKKVTVSQVYKV